MPIRPQTIPAAPSTSSPVAGIDPDMVLAAVLIKVKTSLQGRLLELVPAAMQPPGKGAQHDDRPYRVTAAIASAIGDLGLEARRLRGRRLVRRVALEEIEQILRDIENDESFKRHPAESRAARMLITTYLQREERRDARACQKLAAVGGDLSHPPEYRAPTMPTRTAEET